MYTNNCCGMIALKREVAAVPKGTAGFPWSECQEAMQMAKEPDGKSLYKQFVCNTAETRALSVPDIRVRKSAHRLMKRQDTHGGVYSHRLSYF